MAHALADLGKPVVLVNGFDEDMRVSSVSLDYELGGELAAKHLTQLGHTKLAMLTAQTRPSIRKRTYGFERRAKEQGAEQVTVVDILDFCEQNGRTELADDIRKGQAGADFGASKILPQILDSGQLDGASAIFCLCDRTAITLIEELENRGISVPEDVSVLGFDNLSIGTMISPSLSSIGCDYAHMAKSSIESLFHEFSDTSDIAKRISLGVRLFERESTKIVEHH